jgi:hypothetical protein
MDLWIPLRGHAEWIAQFRETLYSGTGLTSSMVIDDEACEVGQWLAAHADSLYHLHEFQAAKHIHRQFHYRAAYCLQLATSGRRAEALAETEATGELRLISRRMVKAFQALKRQAARQRVPVPWTVVSARA